MLESDKQWIEDMEEGFYFSQSKQQVESIVDMHPEYRNNCVNKLKRLRATAEKFEETHYVELITKKIIELEALDQLDAPQEEVGF